MAGEQDHSRCVNCSFEGVYECFLPSIFSDAFQKMAIWHMCGLAPFVTLLRASVSQRTGRGPLSVMELLRAIAQPRL